MNETTQRARYIGKTYQFENNEGVYRRWYGKTRRWWPYEFCPDGSRFWYVVGAEEIEKLGPPDRCPSCGETLT